MEVKLHRTFSIPFSGINIGSYFEYPPEPGTVFIKKSNRGAIRLVDNKAELNVDFSDITSVFLISRINKIDANYSN